MASPDTLDKIRKLLALANDKRGNENEAARALELATALMMRYGVTHTDLDVDDKRVAQGNFIDAQDAQWTAWLAEGAGKLYGCRPLYWRRRKKGDDEGIAFVGRSLNVQASEATYAFLVRQVDDVYRLHLPRGLAKSERAQYRRTFKEACALRVLGRILEIIANLKTEEGAQEATGCTALVVINHRDELDKEVEDFFEQEGTKTRRSREVSIKPTKGALEGYLAGDTIKIQQEVKDGPEGSSEDPE